jgi:hypothetical protein
VNLFTIPAHAPFLDALAAAWLARGGDALAASRGLILLPTRRAARALAEAFLPPMAARCCCRASRRSARWTRCRWRCMARWPPRPPWSRCRAWQCSAG